MNPLLDEDGIVPPFVLCFLKPVVANPEHKPLPGFSAARGVLTCLAILF